MISSLRKIVGLLESGWRHPSILVVGDVMLDQYVVGEVERISPEAPVPVVRTTFRDEKPGGAANVAMNLAGLGACVTLLGFAGGDREQEALEALVAAEGIEPDLTPVPGAPTTTKLRVLCGHQQILRLDTEATPTFSAADYQHLLDSALSALPAVAAVVLSDYAKGTLTEEVCQTLIHEARRRNIPVLVDPKSRDFARYQGATAICPNRKELSQATGEPVGDLDRLLTAGQHLLSSIGMEWIAVTLSEKGIAVLQKGSRILAPAAVRQVYDVSGAGDTVIAVLALAAAAGVGVETAAQLANLAAGIVVGKAGTVPIQKEELLGALSQEISLRLASALATKSP